MTELHIDRCHSRIFCRAEAAFDGPLVVLEQQLASPTVDSGEPGSSDCARHSTGSTDVKVRFHNLLITLGRLLGQTWYLYLWQLPRLI
jgi:hypothetical protein